MSVRPGDRYLRYLAKLQVDRVVVGLGQEIDHWTRVISGKEKLKRERYLQSLERYSFLPQFFG